MFSAGSRARKRPRPAASNDLLSVPCRFAQRSDTILSSTSRTLCEESSTSVSFPTDRASLEREKARVQAEIDRLDSSSCWGCLLTGVGTCLGLSTYFFYLGYGEEQRSQRARLRQIRQRPFYVAISASWLVVGAYRLHLG
jgi:hypothetical protein